MTIADILLAFDFHEVTTKWKTIKNAELSGNVLNPVYDKA
jgi:hypothetical protein